MTGLLTRLATGLARFIRSRGGNVSAIMTLTLIPMVGALGVGAEASAWYLVQRATQNAADAAAMAAAANACNPTNACSTSRGQSTYIQEARSVTAKYGFAHDGGDTDVTVSDSAPCPGGGSTCYSVAISHKVPFYLLKIVGFRGDTTTASGVLAQTVTASARAKRFAGRAYCITALGSGNDAILLNGANDADFSKCDAYTPNGGSRCNGANAQEAFRTAYMVNPHNSQACPGRILEGDVFTDNFDDLASSIPSAATACGGTAPSNFPQATNQGVPTGAGNDNITSLSGTVSKCGDIRLGGNVNVTTATTLYIYNGRLDLNGYTLSTSGANGSLTVVFTGTSVSGGSTTYQHSFYSNKNGSTVNISGNTSGTWSGVAIYQDPTLTGNKNNLTFDYSGNQLDLFFSGLFYAKNAHGDFAGDLGLSSTGPSCNPIIIDTITIRGTVNASTAECTQAGLPQAYNLINLVG